MTGILFDLDGVLYQGDRAIPGAAAAVAWFQQQHIPLLFLTNTSSRPRSALVEKLQRFSIDIDPSTLLTPAVAAVRWLSAQAPGKVALFVPDATKAEFAALLQATPTSDEPVAAVVIGDLGEAWDFATLNRAFRLLIQDPHPQLIALGMTRYWQAVDGLRLDVAPFAMALEHASGVAPLVMGKPAKPFFEAALDMLGESAANAIMVGDDIRGDIDGAQRVGIRGVLVKTGKFRPHDLAQGIEPAAMLASVAELPAWWRQHIGV